ncbi:MAG: carbohydrate ABC transporter substrate-binding protein [Caldilineaceae bacterium]|nr:carbohydrate ABC transporter substrate-binding protein [Caldilineaceae bacterium]
MLYWKRMLVPLVLVALFLSGCAGTAAPSDSGATDTAADTAADADAELSGSLSFYPQNYYNPEALPDAAAVVEAVRDEYTTENPGVSIELVPYVGDANTYRSWLLTRLSAGQAPNITWEQYSDRNAEGAEVWVDLTDYFEQPNPYVAEGEPGSKRWADLFPDYVLAQTRGGDGRWYEVSLDWIETGLFYNKEVFTQAGIEPDWTNMEDLMADCQALRDAGVEPVGVFITPEWSTYQWLDDIFFSSAFSDVGPEWYMEKYNIPGRDFRRLNPEEFAKAVHDGHVSVDNERFDVYLDLVKQFTDACIMDGFAGGVALADVERMFVEGQVSMAWLTTGSATGLAESVKFDYGLTYFPPISNAMNPHEIHTDSSYRVGGPSGNAQYGITQVTAQQGLLDEALDFLMFWTAPQNFSRVYDSYPALVPMVAGVEPSEIAAEFQFVAGMPERLVGDPIARLTPQFGTEHNRLFQQFMLGEIDAETLKTQYQPLLEQGATDACTQNEWDWCGE